VGEVGTQRVASCNGIYKDLNSKTRFVQLTTRKNERNSTENRRSNKILLCNDQVWGCESKQFAI
jgi:hypothetical protein